MRYHCCYCGAQLKHCQRACTYENSAKFIFCKRISKMSQHHSCRHIQRWVGELSQNKLAIPIREQSKLSTRRSEEDGVKKTARRYACRTVIGIMTTQSTFFPYDSSKFFLLLLFLLFIVLFYHCTPFPFSQGMFLHSDLCHMSNIHNDLTENNHIESPKVWMKWLNTLDKITYSP